MTERRTPRKSLCSRCGKRLSEKNASGSITWKASSIDDKGLVCEDCRAAEKPATPRKNA